jgi:tetratricopeptide (TPR) repeat protein
VGFARTFHAAARIAGGELEAVADARAGFALTASTGSRGGAPAALAQLAQAYLAAGLLEDAQGAVETGLALAAETGQAVYSSVLHLLKARVLLASGGAPDMAEAVVRRAISIARAQGARSFELRATSQLAQWLRDRGERDAARALLAPLYAWFSEGFETADLVTTRALLDSLA